MASTSQGRQGSGVDGISISGVWQGRRHQVVKRRQGSTALPTKIGLPHWTSHDLRRTAATWMADLGVAPHVIGHVLNHRAVTQASVTDQVYNRYSYDREKRAALDLWATILVDHCRRPGRSDPAAQRVMAVAFFSKLRIFEGQRKELSRGV